MPPQQPDPIQPSSPNVPPIVPIKTHRALWIVAIIALLVFGGAGIAFASPAIRTTIVQSIQKILHIESAATTDNPKEDDSLYEDSTSTIQSEGAISV